MQSPALVTEGHEARCLLPTWRLSGPEVPWKVLSWLLSFMVLHFVVKSETHCRGEMTLWHLSVSDPETHMEKGISALLDTLPTF